MIQAHCEETEFQQFIELTDEQMAYVQPYSPKIHGRERVGQLARITRDDERTREVPLPDSPREQETQS